MRQPKTILVVGGQGAVGQAAVSAIVSARLLGDHRWEAGTS